MNNKKNFIFGSIIAVIIVGGGLYYFFIPGAAQDVSFNVSDGASGTDASAIDVDISSSTDVSSSSFSNDDPADQKIPIKNNKSPVSTKKNISPVENNNANDDAGAIASDNSENNSSAPIIPATSCSFPDGASSGVSRKIIFNEIAWMGAPSSSNAEWMELKNISMDTIDLSGWELLNKSGKITVSFSSGDAIPADGILLLSRNNSSTGISYSGNLSNAGDILTIMDSQCMVSDLLDASSGWSAGNNSTKQTMERDADGVGWHTSVSPGGTPGIENSSVVPPIPKISTSSVENNVIASPNEEITSTITTATTATDPDSASTINSTLSSISTDVAPSSSAATDKPSGHVLIAAVQIAGVSSTNDFVKFYNPTGGSIDMSGWKLHKRSSTGTDYSLKSFPTGSVIAAGQSFAWANSTGGFSETIGANVSSTETLSADNSVALLNTNGDVIDAVAWGTGTGQYGEGPPYSTDPTNGQVLRRQLVNGSMVDTSNNANDFIVQ